jgi:uncharacterized protein (TIGR02646 family)
MIPVSLQPEPADFDQKVRKAGYRWLEKNGIPADQPLPTGSKLPPSWQKTQKELWDAYSGVCAYLCIYFAWPLGASSTDHFVAKSRLAGEAYEWSNYRLSCLGMNRNKNRFDDILDPFEISLETFLLNLPSGEIRPNPDLTPDIQEKAWTTIIRLRLNDRETKRMRFEHYDDYSNKQVSESHLKKHSPFVWYEANRQGLL